MKIAFYIIFILFFGLNQHASSQQFKTPVEYHNFIVNEQLKVVNTIINFSNQFNSTDSVLLSNYTNSKAILKKSLENIKKLPPYDSNSELKNAAVSLFEMYYSAMNIEYKEIVDLFIKKDFGKKTQERVNFLLKSINEKEKNLDDKLSEAQANFAKKYHLEIKNNDIQQKVNSIGK